jgi:hypothetical protein
VSAPTLVKAAKLFLLADSRRKARPVLTPQEKTELSLELNALAGGVPLDQPTARARRGEVAASVIGYEDEFQEVAANVIADIMHAVRARGGDPLRVVAQARSYFFEDEMKDGRAAG